MIKSHKYVKTETLDNSISKYSTLVYDTESKLYGSLNAEKNIFDKFGAIRTVIASYGPVGFFVNLGLDFANDLFNISEQCQYAVKTYGAAKIADAVADLLQDDLDKIGTIGEFYYVRNLDLPTNFERLGLARAYAEITYISLKEKAPDLMEAMSDHTDVTRSKLVINEIRRLLNLEEDFFDRWQ